MKNFLKNLLLCIIILTVNVTVLRPAWSQAGGEQPAPHVEAKVASLQWKRESAPDTSYADVGNILYVLKGTRVKFRATKDDSNRPWSDGKPEWSGSSGVSGTGIDEVAVPFTTLSTNTTDFKTVTAKASGDSEATANVVVADIIAIANPHDPFANRSQDRYGVGEVVYLSFSTTPTGISASDIGGLTWVLGSGPANLTGGTNGRATLTAKASEGAVNLKLRVTGGPSMDQEKTLDKTIVKPSGAYMIQEPGSTLRHTQTWAGVGFHGLGYVEPRDVSFKFIEWREGSVAGIGKDYFSSLNGKMHATGEWLPVNGGDSVKGSKIGGIDTVDSGDWTTTPYSDGTFLWPIPWQWRLGTGSPQNATTATHSQSIDKEGSVTIQKLRAGPFTKALNAATGDFHPAGSNPHQKK